MGGSALMTPPLCDALARQIRRHSVMRVLFLTLFGIAVHLVQGAIPSAPAIDQSSVDALLAGGQVCGDAAHRQACLDIMACAEVDERLSCDEEDPLFTPHLLPSTGGGVRFRAVLPLPSPRPALCQPCSPPRPSLARRRAQ